MIRRMVQARKGPKAPNALNAPGYLFLALLVAGFAAVLRTPAEILSRVLAVRAHLHGCGRLFTVS